MNSTRDSFVLQGRDLVGISCLSSDRSYAVQCDGTILGLFEGEQSDDSLKKAVGLLPSNCILQVHRTCWELEQKQFVSLAFPFEEVGTNYSPLNAMRLGAYFRETLAKFHKGPDEAFERMLDFRKTCGLMGANLFKVEAENIAYSPIGRVSLQDDVVETAQIVGSVGLYRVNGIYGAAIDIVAFSDFECSLLPDGAFYSTSTVRRVSIEEAMEIRANTAGARVFGGHLKKEFIDAKDLDSLDPYAFSHTIIFLDSSHKNINKRIKEWSRHLLLSGVSPARMQLRLGAALRAALPGQGSMHPSSIYLDRGACAKALVAIQRGTR